MKLSLNKILIFLIFFLAFVIIFCSITAFAFGKARLDNYRKRDPSSVIQLESKKSEVQHSDLKNPHSAKLQSFNELGTLRALTKPEGDDSVGVNLVVTPWLSFFSEDSAFIEELSHKKKSITTIFLNYFSAHTQKELLKFGEKKVKSDLLEKINSSLVFGKIENVYFDDYIFID